MKLMYYKKLIVFVSQLQQQKCLQRNTRHL